MSNLAAFTKTTIPAQTQALSFGVKSADIFRVTSSFIITSATPAYAMASGTILLQQQSNVKKVNLILRPDDQKEFKLPIKYIVYRGLKTTDFIENTNLADINNKVKTAGSELLNAIKHIQDLRAPDDDIPLQALFGNDLAPPVTKNVDDFFF